MNGKLLMAILMVLGALLAAAPALADGPGEGKQKGAGKGKNKVAGMPFQWKATSPAIHEGDRYTLLVTNNGDEAQNARIRAVIMDHRNHTNADVVDEQVNLEPGEEREFTAVNDYGDANHFNTIIGSQTRDLELAVSVVDAAGTETARFTQGAFLVKEGAGRKGAAKAGGHAHGHDGGFAALVPTALTDTARLSPLPLGVLAVAGIGLYAARRRWAWAGSVGDPAVLPSGWKGVAAGGLALSAALHIGLAPVHFQEAAVQGFFFTGAGVVAAILAAAVLVWPSRPVYLAGAALSLSLIGLWATFLILPPPGTEAAEAVDLVGLFVKAAELVAAVACVVLWYRDRLARRSGRVEP